MVKGGGSYKKESACYPTSIGEAYVNIAIRLYMTSGVFVIIGVVTAKVISTHISGVHGVIKREHRL